LNHRKEEKEEEEEEPRTGGQWRKTPRWATGRGNWSRAVVGKTKKKEKKTLAQQDYKPH
jgi:hypothetical protein